MTFQVPGYSITRTLGRGGMATVYLATHKASGKRVALKTVAEFEEELGESNARAGALEIRAGARLKDEARLIAALSHPNIVKTYDVGCGGGCLYIVMEYLAGGDLKSRISAGMSPAQVIKVCAAIASALSAAHAKQIIHRDIKPANILFRADGAPVLSDFGVAKVRAGDSDDNELRSLDLTQTGAIIGSPFYMSPEQADGDLLGPQSDIYSLGIVAYEMLTGAPPFRAKNLVRTIMMHLREPVPPLPGELGFFQPLIEKMLAKDPQDRFPSAAELLRALRAIVADHRDLAVFKKRLHPGGFDAHSDTALQDAIANIEAGVREDLQHDRLVLPSLPEVALDVRAALGRADVDAKALARIIATDPALSARLIGVANSALHATPVPIRDLVQAVVRLGRKLVGTMVNMLIVAQLYEAQSRPRIQKHLRETWRQSLLVSSLSELLAKRYSHLDPGASMLAGLIHDIGKLPILVWADQVPHVLDDNALLDAVSDRLHRELAVMILQSWEYPQDIVDAIGIEQKLSEDSDEDEQADQEPLRDGEVSYNDIVTTASLLAKAHNSSPAEPRSYNDWPHCQRALQRLGISSAEGLRMLEIAVTLGSQVGDAVGGNIGSSSDDADEVDPDFNERPTVVMTRRSASSA